MNTSDNVRLLEESKRNMDLELVRFEDRRSKWDWLIHHLGIYLRRLEGFCNELDTAPREFLQSSLFCHIWVATTHMEQIMLERGQSDGNWTALMEALAELSDAVSMTKCISCFESFRITFKLA